MIPLIEKSRKIIHIDMDAFYASIEQRDNPELRNKPIVVGGNEHRGVVAAASYEARKYGIHSAMPAITAKRKCNSLIFVKPRFELYQQVSQEIHTIFYDYTDLVEPLSLDEAYLDVTENKKGIKSATDIATKIRVRIAKEVHLTASAGIAKNKFIAKIATEQHKPDGQFLVHPDKSQLFIDGLPITSFYGVGSKTAERMHKLDIHQGRDLRSKSLDFLSHYFGKQGLFFYKISRTIDDRPVLPHRQRKSIGAERTFEDNLSDIKDLRTELNQLLKTLFERIDKSDFSGKTVTIKLRNSAFKTYSKSHTPSSDFLTKEEIKQTSMDALAQLYSNDTSYRLLGVSLNNPNSKTAHQLTLSF